MLPALLLATLATFSGRPTVATQFVPPPRLTVGDHFDVTFVLQTRHPSLITGPLADTLGPFVLAEEKRRTDVGQDHDRTTCRVTVACFQPGRHRLPPLTFIVTAGSQVDTLHTDTLGVTVVSVLPANMQGVHGLKPPETFPNVALWLIPAALALALALAWLGWRLYQRLRTIAEAERPALPPWEEALAALDALPWRDWLADGDAKRFYYALSEILKRYIERRFEFDAVEQTTTELLANMRLLKLPMRDDIGRFFARSDIVKYAKLVPPLEESEKALEQVREFVLRTKPAEVVTAPAAAVGAPQTGTA